MTTDVHDPFEPAVGPPEARLVEDGTPGSRTWQVGAHALVTQVLTDPAFGVEAPGSRPEDNPTLFRDGPPHRRLRGLVARAFTPRRVEALAGSVARTAEDAVVGMVAAGPPADLVEHLAVPLSVGTITGMLGIDDAQRDAFRQLADDAMRVDPADHESLARGWDAFFRGARRLVAQRRAAPGPDLLSGLIAVHDEDGDRLSEDELVGMVVSLVGAGYVSSRNAIAVAAVHASGRLDAVDDDLVEEVLRLVGGVTGEPMPRWARREVRLGEVTVAAGDRVQVSTATAHRDPRVFPAPRSIERRRPNPHLTFGRGPHHCLGAAIARLEIRHALLALGRHVPGLTLAVAPQEVGWTDGLVDSGPTTLPVTW